MEPEIGPITLLSDQEQEDLELLDQLLNEEEKVLKVQLENTEQKKSKLSTDLDMFLNQIQGMHNGFSALKQNGNRKSSGLVHHQLHVECHHERGSSLDTMDIKSTPHGQTLPNIGNRPDHTRHSSIVW